MVPSEGGSADLLRKPVNALAIVPQSKRITPLFRKSYNVMLYLAQEQGLEKDIFRAPLSNVIRGLDFDSNDTALVKKHLRAMASTTVEWQSPTTGEGSTWAVSGLIGHAEIKRERGQVWLEWSYSVKLKQELLQPSVFARLSIEIISQLRSHGGIALYEICSRYRDVGRTARQPWSWWRPVLSGKPETDKTRKQEYRFFKRDVLKLAIAEVNAITDITVELVEHKAGRFISELQFKVAKKAQAALPLRAPPAPLDLSLVIRAQKLGIDDLHAEELLHEHGDAALRAGLDALEKRIATAYPEPLRDPYRYLRTLLTGEASRAPKKETIEIANQPAAPRQNMVIESKRHARWQEEWLRRRREKVISDLQSLSEEEQTRIAALLLDDMEARKVHPSIRKRLQTSGWQHPMVLHEMVRFYAAASIGEHWDKPTPQQLLEVAGQLGDE
ncbi:replication initiation protein [Caldimonas tepidiphila]|uniref:replication initiation protein n=1 Tax=Caldimonas tepidiphila TaxID=2315841 RepID=UPI0013008EE2|nr:replication initiation protein [Caldimonas tepidiphila]